MEQRIGIDLFFLNIGADLNGSIQISGLYAGFCLIVHNIARKLRVFVLHARKTALESLFCLVILLAFQISDAERPVALRQSVACLYGSLQHRNRRYVVLLFERLDALFIKL